MLNKIKNNNIAATTAVERGLMYLCIFFVGTFILDMILLATTMLTLNHELNYVATKLQFQGGFVGSTVDDNSSHWVNRDFYNYINGAMAKFGIDGTVNVWGLDYYPDYINEDAEKIEICNTKSTLKYKNTYKTPDRGVNVTSTTADIGNLYKTSHLVLWFDYQYVFSGKVFGFNKVRMKLETDFKNEYIN